MDLLVNGRGQRDKGRGIKKELRCLMYMYQIPTWNVIRYCNLYYQFKIEKKENEN